MSETEKKAYSYGGFEELEYQEIINFLTNSKVKILSF